MGDPVDVLICIKNSEATILPTLYSIIYSDIPIKSFVIVDGNSRDKTLELIREFLLEEDKVFYIYQQGRMGYGDAINEALKIISTPIFASVDSDVIIPEDFYKTLSELIKIDGVIVASIYNIVTGNNGLREYYYYRAEKGKLQCSLGQSLINKEYVKDCLPLPENISGADTVLYRKAMGKGYKWVNTRISYSYTVRGLTEELKHLKWWGEGAYHIGNNPLRILLTFPYSILLGIWLSRRNIKCLYAVPLRMLFYTYGYFREMFRNIRFIDGV